MSTNLPALLPQSELPAIPPINLGDRTALMKRAANAVDLAESMVVDSTVMAEQLQSECATWGAEADVIEANRKGYTKPFDDAKAAIMDWYRPVNEAYAKAREISRKKLADFATAERARVERERREAAERQRQEQERLRVEIRRKAEEAAAEDRRAAEARAAAERATDEDERRRLEAEAKQRELCAAAQREAAEIDRQVADVIPAPVIVEAAKVKGVSTREVVDIEVTDKAQALAWFAANPMFAECIEFSDAKLKAMQKSLGDRFNVPGVKVTKTLGVASRKAAA
jgi:DNA polymerase III alpha subunit (gram-positive type)